MIQIGDKVKIIKIGYNTLYDYYNGDKTKIIGKVGTVTKIEDWCMSKVYTLDIEKRLAFPMDNLELYSE